MNNISQIFGGMTQNRWWERNRCRGGQGISLTSDNDKDTPMSTSHHQRSLLNIAIFNLGSCNILCLAL